MRRKGSCRLSFRPRGRRSDKGEEKEGLVVIVIVCNLVNQLYTKEHLSRYR